MSRAQRSLCLLTCNSDIKTNWEMCFLGSSCWNECFTMLKNKWINPYPGYQYLKAEHCSYKYGTFPTSATALWALVFSIFDKLFWWINLNKPFWASGAPQNIIIERKCNIVRGWVPTSSYVHVSFRIAPAYRSECKKMSFPLKRNFMLSRCNHVPCWSCALGFIHINICHKQCITHSAAMWEENLLEITWEKEWAGSWDQETMAKTCSVLHTGLCCAFPSHTEP